MSTEPRLLDRIEDSIRARKLLEDGQGVLVAVSGGVDSMVLLELLYRLAPCHAWRIIVAHFNHQLRGRSSDADEKLVRSVCKKLKIPVAVGTADVRKHALEHGLSVEMAARELRHRFLAEEARRTGCHRIAVAHHANDQMELFFIRLLRGAGSEGLAGMKWESQSPVDRELKLIRPLLDLTKEELEIFAGAEKIKYREDQSNFDEDILRNRIRRKLIPLLEGGFQPALNKVLTRQMEILGAESDCIHELAAEWLESGGGCYDELPVAVQRRSLQMQFLREGIAPNFDLIEQMRLEAGRPVSVAPGRTAMRDKDGCLSVQETTTAAFAPGMVSGVIAGREGQFDLGNVKIEWSLHESPRGTFRAPKRQLHAECFDADKVGRQILLRHWRAGDRFQPIGLAAAVKLQDLFTNSKVPRDQRRELVVAETAAGEIFWVEGQRMSERFKTEKGTRNLLQWRWKRLCFDGVAKNSIDASLTQQEKEI